MEDLDERFLERPWPLSESQFNGWREIWRFEDLVYKDVGAVRGFVVSDFYNGLGFGLSANSGTDWCLDGGEMAILVILMALEAVQHPTEVSVVAFVRIYYCEYDQKAVFIVFD